MNQSNPIEYQSILLDFDYQNQSKINHSKKMWNINALSSIGVRLCLVDIQLYTFDCFDCVRLYSIVILFDYFNYLEKMQKQNMYLRINCDWRFNQLLKECKNLVDIWLPSPIENQSNQLVFDWFRLIRLIQLRLRWIGYPWLDITINVGFFLWGWYKKGV